MSAVSLLVVILVLFGVVLLARRNRQRVAAGAQGRAELLDIGAQVMTTSGLYATVVSLETDGTAVLSIAPGVEVTWAVAALRPVTDLPPKYRRGDDPGRGGGPGFDGPDAGPQAEGGPTDRA